MARLLLDVGHRHRLFLHHVLRGLPLADSVFPREHDSRNHRAVEILRRADGFLEHARVRHGDLCREPHRGRRADRQIETRLQPLFPRLVQSHVRLGAPHLSRAIRNVDPYLRLHRQHDRTADTRKNTLGLARLARVVSEKQVLQCLPLPVRGGHLGIHQPGARALDIGAGIQSDHAWHAHHRRPRDGQHYRH